MGRRIEDFSDAGLVEVLNAESTGESVVLTAAVVHAELTRRNTVALVTSAKRTEFLTWALVAFTVALVVLTVVLVIQGAD